MSEVLQTSGFQLRVLGSIEAFSADTPVSLGGKTQRRLLAVMVLSRGRVVSVDRLVDVTWGDEPPARAAHNIRTYLHRLRNALDHGAEIITVEPGYRLDLRSAVLDSDLFEQDLDTARRHYRSGHLSDALESCTEALRLWGGQPYAEFAFEDWARAEVVRLQELYEEARELESELLLVSGRVGSALSWLDSIIEEHPLREKPRALRLRALFANGRQTDALREFQSYRNTLIEEVGVEPSAELQELDRAIARGDQSVIEIAQPEIGGYKLHEEVGRGAFAAVHRATQTSLDREVAVKIIRAELANQPDFVRSFETEARAISRIEHPNVVPLYDFWRDPDRACLVMRFMPGGSLSDRLTDGPLPAPSMLGLIDDIAGALSAAHQRGLVHRDVKPANILFDDLDRPYLGDFGVALDLTSPETSWGADDVRYAAPEQLDGWTATPATDVYGLASVALVALTGETLFASSNSVDQLRTDKRSGLLAGVAKVQSIEPAVLDVLARAGSPTAGNRPQSVTQFAAELRVAVEGVSQKTTLKSGQFGQNPYVGLSAFDQAVSDRFFGRSRLVDELVTKLDQNHTLAVVGASGSGKSSVVQAGLLPAIHRGRIAGSDRWFTTSMTPGARPFEALETALLRVAVNPPSALLDQLRDPDRGLIRAMRRILPEDGAVLVLFVDQFEELFTNVTDPVTAEAFLDALTTAVSEPDSPLRLVATLRADFYDRPLRHAGFAPIIKAATVAVTPLAPDELEEVIVGPAASAGKQFVPGLVAEIMADASSQPGSLPLLQFALTRAYDQSTKREITAHDYRSVGGILGSLTQRAEELFEDLSSGRQRQLRRLMGQLVALGEGSEDTRRVAHRSELGDVDEILERFGSARLLTFDNDPATHEPTVEVAHEALIRKWPRLRTWLDEDRDDLRIERHLVSVAQDWDETGRPDSELYRGGRLETAEAWAAEHEATPASAAFLDASTALRQREIDAEKQRFDEQVANNRRLRRSLAGVAVMLVCALVAGVVAFQQRSNARTAAAAAEVARQDAVDSEGVARAAAADAETARFDAETGRLVAQAQALAETNPRAAMLLAAAAHQREQSPATLGGLQVALSKAGPLLGWLGYGQAYEDVHWIGDDRVVGVRPDGLDLFDVSTGEILDSMQAPIEPNPGWNREQVTRTAIGDNHVAVASAGKASVYRVGTEFEFEYGAEPASKVEVVALSADGLTLATGEAGAKLSLTNSDGETIFHRDFDDSETWLDQNFDLVPEVFRWIFEEVPVVTGFYQTNDDSGVWFLTGPHIRKIGWDGSLAEPIELRVTGPFGEVPTAGNSVFTNDDGEPIAVLREKSLWTTNDGPPGDRIVTKPIPALGAASLPSATEILAVNPSEVFVALNDGTLAVVSTETKELRRTVEAGLGLARGSDLHEGSSRVAIATNRGVAVVSTDQAGPVSTSFPLDGGFNLSISYDGEYALAGPGGSPGSTKVWVREGTRFSETSFVSEHLASWAELPVSQISYMWFGGPSDPQPQEIYALGDEPRVWSTITDVEGASSGDISPDGEQFASGRADTRLWDIENDQMLLRLPLPEEATALEGVTGTRFHPLEPLLIQATETGKAQIWNTETWTPVANSLIEGANISAAFWSLDGTLVASASSSGDITIRDGSSFKPIREMVGAAGIGNTFAGGALVLSHDNSLLLTNFDGPGRLWDVATGQQIGADFETSRRTNSGVNFGETLQLITGTEEHAVIWNLDIDEWPEIACTTAGSNLTRAEWEQWGPRDEHYGAICPQFPLPG